MAQTKKINLALQGGGAHGAFTWGVLDRLLQEDGLEICGMSGTSAGALNGAALKAGMISGGRQGRRMGGYLQAAGRSQRDGAAGSTQGGAGRPLPLRAP